MGNGENLYTPMRVRFHKRFRELRRMKIFCIIQVRNEARFLPGFLHHMAPHVDGIIALDDCSTDNTLELLRAEPKVVTILRENEPAPPHAHEVRNRHRLIVEAARQGADWVLCADADERYETRFLRRIYAVAQANERRRDDVLFVRIVNLWDSPDQYRTDGKCAPRYTARMFRMPDMISRRRAFMHLPWFPPELDKAKRRFLPAILYHLKMIHRDDREARHAKFTAIDPDNTHQSIGYGHLIDEEGLTVQKILTFRGYEDLPVSQVPTAASSSSSSDEVITSQPPPHGLCAEPTFVSAFHLEEGRATPLTIPMSRHRPTMQGFNFQAIFTDMRARRG